MPLAHTIDDLIKEFKVNKASKGFYSTPAGLTFLSATNRNQLSFIWEAQYKDGTRLYQFDEITFLRALQDESFIPPADQIVSTDRLDKKQVVHYELHPIAYTMKECPWFQRSYRVNLRPEKGERLLAYWCTDYQVNTRIELRRHAFGIKIVNPFCLEENGEEKELSRTVFIISPSGNMVLSSSDNLSIEGE